MKEITAALWRLFSSLYSSIVLLSVELNPDSTSSLLVSNQERISDERKENQMGGKTDQIKGRIKEAAGALTITTVSRERESLIK
jgi:hypothetical protein